MEPNRSDRRTYEMTDPAMAPIKAWIESYVVWTDLPKHTRASILKRASRGEADAIDALCNHNLRLVLSLAVKQVGRGVPLPDLIQEGWLGLREAAQRYEPQRGNTFSTMATWWIKQKLLRSTVTQGRTLYLPHKANEVLLRVARMVQHGEELQAEDQQWLDSLARQIYGNPDLHNVTFDYFDHLLRGPRSLEKPFQHYSHGGAETEVTLEDVIAAPSDSDPSGTLDLEALLLEMVNLGERRGGLTRREGWLIVRHFGLDGEGGRKYEEMAQELYDAGVAKSSRSDKPLSRQRIEQIFSNAMRKVRQYVAQTQGHTTWQVLPANGTLKEQTKRLSSAPITGQSESTESPKTKSVRRTPINDSSKETAASRSAAPLRLRAKSSTKRAKGSSRPAKGSGLDVQYPEAI